MISIETMKYRTSLSLGAKFPLVFWRGTGRIVASDDTGLDVLVRGMRAHYTWERLTTTWQRLLANHTLGIDELGGGHDAVGIVSLFADMQADAVSVNEADGLLVLDERQGTPVHQYADMSLPRTWSPFRRKIDGD
jgi:hypothetical protein